MQSTSRRSMLNYIGIAILIVGLGAGEFIYWRSLRHESAAGDADSPYDSRVYEQTMERTVGIFGVIMDQWSRTAERLEEPRPLAITIGVASMVAAGGCFMAASRMPRV